VAKQPEACFTCHTDIRYQANKQSHHPIIEGKVKCSDCHNPHGSTTHGMLKADSVNLLCYKCHADKRGPYLWEHPPVEENCLACHDSHGTKASKLLKEKLPNLCQDCHDAQRHPGTPYDARTTFLGNAKSNKMYGRSCLNCHGVIHGSNAPENPSSGNNSGRFFTR
jgi:DmsE family decaheme c-type cytochrome